MGEEGGHISAWELKEYKVCNFGLSKRPTGHSSKSVSSFLCSPVVALIHAKGPRLRRKICANSLWLYSYFTQTSPSKNKNMNYIFIYLRGFRYINYIFIYLRGFRYINYIFIYLRGFYCLSSGAICDICKVLFISAKWTCFDSIILLFSVFSSW